MLEMKITVTAADLAAAINNLADALNGKTPHTVCNQYGADNQHIDNTGTVNMDVGGEAQPAPTANPMPTQAIQQTAPAAPTAPIANPAPVAPAPVQQAPVTQQPYVAPAAQVPTAAPAYSLEAIATAGTSLVDAGKMDQLMTLLGKYGIDSITKLDPSQYGVFATELRALGARI